MYNDYNLMNADNRNSLPSCTCYRDGNDIHIIKRTPQKGIRLNFSAGTIGIFVLILIKTFGFSNNEHIYSQNTYATEHVVETSSVQVETGYTQPEREVIQETMCTGAFESAGEVFPDSSERYLSDEEIATLGMGNTPVKFQLVQQAINEIYARNGYAFQEKVWKDYYDQFSWYHNRGLNDAETKERFNAVERENVEKLKRIRDNLND